MTIDISLIIVILNFLLLVIVLNGLLYKPLKGYLQSRQKKIADDIAEAANGIQKAEQLVVERETELRKSMEEARHIKDSIKSEAEVHADKIIQAAKQTERDIINDTEYKIQEMSKHARTIIESDLADIIVDLTKKVLAEKMDSESDKQLIQRVLATRGIE